MLQEVHSHILNGAVIGDDLEPIDLIFLLTPENDV